jgi:hypothetical protein
VGPPNTTVSCGSCQSLINCEFAGQIFEESSNIKFYGNPSSWSRIVPCGKTDRHDEANSYFHKFPNAPQKCDHGGLNGMTLKRRTQKRRYESSSMFRLRTFPNLFKFLTTKRAMTNVFLATPKAWRCVLPCDLASERPDIRCDRLLLLTL